MNESPLIEISKATVWCGTTQIFKNFSLTIGISTFLAQHFHMLLLDDVYRFRGHRTILHRARWLQPDELLKLLDSLSRRVVRPLERRGLLIADREHAI